MSPELLDRDAPAALFEQLADRLEALIRSGTLGPGERIPSVRKLRDQFAVSISTVLEALRALEDRGLIEARPQSGHYVKRQARGVLDEPGLTRPRPRATNVDLSLAARLNQHMTDLGQKVQLGAAIPDPALLPLRTVNRLLAAVTRDFPEAAHAYDAPPGSAELRHEIARRMLDAGVSVAPDEVTITNGTKEAVYLSLRAVTRPGDTVAIESPTYYDLIEALHSLHLKALPVATHPRDGVCFDSLGKALQSGHVKAVALVTNFSNPLGSCMSDAKKLALVRMLDRYDVPLIEDDVYGDMAHESPRPKAVKAFDTRGSVLYCASFSKTVSPALRVGWSIAGSHQPGINQFKRSMNQCNSLLLQLACAEFLRGGGYDRHLRRLRRAYRDQVGRTADAIASHFPEGTRLTRPTGGHVLWVEMPQQVDSVRLFEEACDAGITIAPGPMFTVDGGFRNCIRLNCGILWSDRVARALETLGSLARRQLA